MIDGRIVYDPLFSGVFWEVQDVLLEDVDRIEVVRGPGATIWGCQCGQRRHQHHHQERQGHPGRLFRERLGTHEQGFSSARYGGQIGDDLSYRIYGKWFDTDDYYSPDFPATDAWQQVHTGLRMDWRASRDDTITFQGDYYNGYDGDESMFPSFMPPDFEPSITDITHVSGDNVLLNWRRTLSEQSDWTAMALLRPDPTPLDRHYGFGEDQNTFDFDLPVSLPAGARNEVICGTEYRNVMDSTYGQRHDQLGPPRDHH